MFCLLNVNVVFIVVNVLFVAQVYGGQRPFVRAEGLLLPPDAAHAHRQGAPREGHARQIRKAVVRDQTRDTHC